MAAVNSPVSSPAKNAGAVPAAKYCLCAPTTHPGSFRCRLHRSTPAKNAAAIVPPPPASEEESEMAAVEATTGAAAAVRAFLARASRNSRQDGGRIRCFQPRTSRLGIMDE